MVAAGASLGYAARMALVHIPFDEDLAPGTWSMRNCAPVHRCPKCRECFTISASVIPSGEVIASIACAPPCDYEVSAILDGWSFGEKRTGDPVVIKRA